MLRSFYYVLAVCCLASCTRNEPVETKEAMKKRLDSLSAERMRQIDERYQRDLYYRIKIEAIHNRDSVSKTTGNTNP